MTGTTFMPAELLHFRNHMSIEINYSNTVKYFHTSKWDEKLLSQGFVWHQIVVRHKGRMRSLEARKMILQAIFDVVEDEEFFPIAYRSGATEDKFLIRNCQNALRKLFVNNLRIQLADASHLNIEIQLNVGNFMFGQISPASLIAQTIGRLYSQMEFLSRDGGILNLSSFHENSEFDNMVVNLQNPAVFALVCNSVFREEKFRNVNGLNLADNGLTTLNSLEIFRGVEFLTLDLQNNELSSVSKIIRSLRHLKADNLLLAGNPIVKKSTYPRCLEPLLNNFKTIDNIPVENLSKDYCPVNFNAVELSSGYRIDSTNVTDIDKFENSSFWHAVIIPDENQEFSKEEIIDYFFVMVSPNHRDIYPCYYELTDRKHQFLVRECFDQLSYLVKECRLQIKIPCLNDIDENKLHTNVRVDKVIEYHVIMEASPFQHGEIDPTDLIDKALDKRFDPMDRILDLENFQATEGLEKIIINFSSINILRRILMQASRKCMGNCVDLRLAKNKIITAAFGKSLVLMSSLKAIDLGNNWIPDLESIKNLGELGIKSLRLDGNPLCSKYRSVVEYTNEIKQYFPQLSILDNVEVATANITTQKNYLCDINGYDFIETFVPEYFKLFEPVNREPLRGFYNEKAIFTMTCDYSEYIENPARKKRLKRYRIYSRNMLHCQKPVENLFFGPNAIIKVFNNLPEVIYDMLTFTLDCVTFNENMIRITITGVFQDQPGTLSDAELFLAFSRTFIIKPVARNLGILKGGTQYEIFNDQLNIIKPTEHQLKSAFVYFKNPIVPEIEPLNGDSKEALMVMFSKVTNLKYIWCRRCLEDANWDFEKALKVFIMLNERNEVPDSAFKYNYLQVDF